MLFFRNLQIFTAMTVILIITAVAIAAAVTCTCYIRSMKKKQKEISNAKAMTLRIAEILLSVIMGFMIADSIMTVKAVGTALSHGMAPVPETDPDNGGKYTNTLDEVLRFNKRTHKESDVDENADLTGKIIIYVRYDCPDCYILYDDMPKPSDDILYIYSRTDLGHVIMDKYDIALTEVPSAVYISPSGEVFIQTLAEDNGDDMHFNITGWQNIISLKYNT